MNREIEFRGYDESSGLWRYGSLLVDGWLMSICQIIRGKIGGWRVNPKSVGQFTGLRDKNGVKIFEGDILKAGNESAPLEVRFVRGVFAFLWNGNLDDEFPCNAPTHEWAEVVGNIYDNPELLNEK